jgi:hypothetical protein
MTLKKVNKIKEEKNTLHARARNLILASQNTTGCCGGSSDNCCEEDDFFNESQTLIDESEPVSVITNKTIELSESALERIADQVSDIVFKKLSDTNLSFNKPGESSLNQMISEEARDNIKKSIQILENLGDIDVCKQLKKYV